MKVTIQKLVRVVQQFGWSESFQDGERIDVEVKSLFGLKCLCGHRGIRYAKFFEGEKQIGHVHYSRFQQKRLYSFY